MSRLWQPEITLPRPGNAGPRVFHSLEVEAKDAHRHQDGRQRAPTIHAATGVEARGGSPQLRTWQRRIAASCGKQRPEAEEGVTATAPTVGAATDLVAGTNFVEKIMGNYDEVTV
jgi:hypothetical protein